MNSFLEKGGVIEYNFKRGDEVESSSSIKSKTNFEVSHDTGVNASDCATTI